MVGQIIRLTRILRAPGVALLAFWGLVAGVGLIIAQLGLPFVVASIVDDALIAGKPDGLAARAILLLFVGLVMNLCRVGHEVAFAWVAGAALDHLQQRLLGHLQRLPIAFFDGERTGRLHSLFTEDAPQIANLAAQIAGHGVLSILQLAALLVLIFVQYGPLLLLGLLLIPIYVLIPAFLTRRTRETARDLAKSRSELNAVIQEALQAVRETKVFNRQEWALGRLRPMLRRKQREHVRLSAFRSAHSLSNFVYFGGGAFVYWYGGVQVTAGRLTVGELIALITLLGILDGPVSRLVGLSALIPSVAASMDRILPLLSLPTEREGGESREAEAPGSSIQFTDVTFTYPGHGAPALDHVTFSIAPGERVALVGPSGAGKSTLVSLLVRLYDPASGEIRLGGRPLREYALPALRSAVGLVMQEPYFFPVTVQENIRFGRLEASDEEVAEAASVANAHDFILQLPAGYATEIGERGVRLSAGQRQRIGIARVVLRDPKILVLDEATSELDAAAELAVHEALNRLAVGRTCLVIAHRLSTVVDADRILVLDAGRVVAQGRHQELLRICELYRHLCEIQLEAGARNPHRNEPSPLMVNEPVRGL